MGLTDGRRGLRLSEEALATVCDQAPHHAGLNLLQVVRLSTDFGHQEADVRLIPGLLLSGEEQEGQYEAFGLWGIQHTVALKFESFRQ